MKDKKDLKLPDSLSYTKEHVWVKPDGSALVIGITDYAQDQLGEVVYVDLPEAGAEFDAGKEFGSVESVKSVNSLFMPVKGKIVEVNESLADEPELVNVNCYEDGWLARVEPDNPDDVKKLLDAGGYAGTL